MRLLLEMKKQLDLELKRDLESLEQRIMTKIEGAEKRTGDRVDSIKSQTAAVISGELAKVNNQISTTNSQAVAIRAQTRELIVKATEKMGAQVYERINKEMMPKFAAAAERLDYHTQDGAEVVDAYRREVYRRHKIDSGQKMLTQGDAMKKIELGEHVGLFWDGTDD